MQTITELRISPNSLASDDSIEKSAPYMELARRVGLRFAVRLLRSDLRHRLCICRDGLRSLRGHIRTQSAIGQVYVRLGPHSDQGARDARTLVRTLYIQKLLAIRPWADSQDLEMFLMGFEAGETFSDDSRDRLYPAQKSARASSWITPDIEQEIHSTLDMLKRLWYKSQYESPRQSSPSQSD
jgi:hypothetical protein